MDSQHLLTLYFTLTQIFAGGKAKINLHTMLELSIHADQLSNAISPPSCFFFNVVRSTYTIQSLNVRSIINWKRYFKENIIKNTLEKERKKL